MIRFEKEQKETLARILIGAALFAAGFFLSGWGKTVCFLAAWGITGYEVIWSALRNLLHGELFDEEFLMSLATGCALALGDFAEAAAVMLLFQVGELFEELAEERSRRSVTDLMELCPDRAILLKDGKETEVLPEEVQIGDILLVRPGERVAVDGVVVAGDSALDTSKMTGEALPVDVSEGSRVISGSINLSGALKIRAETAYAQSTVARILTLVETAEEKKADSERLITRFAKYYTPSVIGAALLLAILPPLFFAQPFSEWLRRALTFLVISCPCALVISVPLSFFSGMGAAAKLGIVVKGGIVLEQLAKSDAVLFDKTGTLTEGSFSVQFVQAAGTSEKEVLRIAAACERYSNHPIAKAISRWSDGSEAEQIREIPGKGVTAVIDGKTAVVGNLALMKLSGISPINEERIGTTVYVALDGVYLGAITVSDTVKENAAQTVSRLGEMGISVQMLTGDNERSAAYCAEACGIEEYRAALLPQDKAELLQGLQKENGKRTVFVGDGVNDAPVLAAADVGIAMGGIGSDAAMEASDAVMLNDDISKLPLLIKTAKKTRRIALQNIIFALAVKGICLLLGALGHVPMSLAIFADVGVTLLAILNSFRALKKI